MSIANEYETMKLSFLEAKDIINQIFTNMKAPEDWQIKHMTFDELIAALYRILALTDGTYIPNPINGAHVILTKENPEQTLEAGNYVENIDTEIGDFDVVYVSNLENKSAVVHTIPYDQRIFNIPIDTGTIDLDDFEGWCLDPDGNGQLYQPADEIEINGFANKADTIIFYAIAKEKLTPLEIIIDKIDNMKGHFSVCNTTLSGSGDFRCEVLLELNGGDYIKSNIETTKQVESKDSSYIAQEITQDNKKNWKVGFRQKLGYFNITATSKNGEVSVTSDIIVPILEADISVGGDIDPRENSGGSPSNVPMIESGKCYDGKYPLYYQIDPEYRYRSNLDKDLYDTGWIPPEPINGVYIDRFSNVFHSVIIHNDSNTEGMSIFARLNDGTEIYLTGLFRSPLITGQIMDDTNITRNTYQNYFNLGKFEKGKIYKIEWNENNISDTLNSLIEEHGKIRQIRVSAISYGHAEQIGFYYWHYIDQGEYAGYWYMECYSSLTDIHLCYDSKLDPEQGGLEAHVHTFDEGEEILAPTCTEEGEKIQTCTECHTTKHVTIPALGHLLRTRAIKVATCLETGQEEDYCERCNQTLETRTVNALGHDYKELSIVQQAKCLEPELWNVRCTRCGDETVISKSEPLGHNFDNGVVTTEPTDYENGIKTYTCQRSGCNVKYTEVIPSIGNICFLETERDFAHNWGYQSIKNNSKLERLYKRIYNAFDNNGEREYLQYSVFGSPTEETATCKSISSSGVVPGYDGYLIVPVEDLKIQETDVNQILWYVYGMVEQDCPELVWKWQSDAPAVYIAHSGYITILALCHYDINTRNNMISTIENTFDEICTLVKQYYDIDYINGSFAMKNQQYTELQKKQIGKVIHDYLEVNNHYGNVAEPETNQNVYAALSKGQAHPVCASYAQAFKYCCDKWGISCIIAIGHVIGSDRDGNHAWNMVSYKQQPPIEIANTSSAWQEVDCTWDDPSQYNTLNNYTSYGITAQMLTKAIKWDHFNVTTAEINNGITAKDLYFEGASGHFTGSKENGRWKDLYGPSDNANTGAQDIGVYSNYPNGTCSTNKYNGNITYGGFEDGEEN